MRTKKKKKATTKLDWPIPSNFQFGSQKNNHQTSAFYTSRYLVAFWVELWGKRRALAIEQFLASVLLINKNSGEIRKY